MAVIYRHPTTAADIPGIILTLLLIEIITNGDDPYLYNTKMPGFGDQLTEVEIKAVLDYIKSSWGQEERELQ